MVLAADSELFDVIFRPVRGRYDSSSFRTQSPDDRGGRFDVFDSIIPCYYTHRSKCEVLYGSGSTRSSVFTKKIGVVRVLGPFRKPFRSRSSRLKARFAFSVRTYNKWSEQRIRNATIRCHIDNAGAEEDPKVREINSIVSV